MPSRKDAGSLSAYGTRPVRCFDEAISERARRALPGATATSRAVDVFSCLAKPTRLHILLAISAVGELCVTDIAHAVDTSVPAVSTHLRLLRAQGIVKRRNGGKNAFYSVRSSMMIDIARHVLHTVQEHS